MRHKTLHYRELVTIWHQSVFTKYSILKKNGAKNLNTAAPATDISRTILTAGHNNMLSNKILEIESRSVR
jgi:hypothetical protein